MAKTPKQEKKSAAKTTSTDTWLNMAKNIGLLLASVMVVMWAEKNVNGYKWVHDSLIGNNLKMMEKFKDADYDKKMELKVAFNYRFAKFLKDNTPENAVIMLPKDTLDTYIVTDPKTKRKQRLEYLSNPGWVSYFTYPRRVLSEGDTSILCDSVTHVAIVNGHGYELLPFAVDQRQQFGVMPMNLSSQTQQTP